MDHITIKADLVRRHCVSFKNTDPHSDVIEPKLESIEESERYEIAYRRRVLEAAKRTEADDWNQCQSYMPSKGKMCSLPVQTRFFLFRRLQFVVADHLSNLASLNQLFGLYREHTWSLQEIDEQLQLIAPLIQDEMEEAEEPKHWELRQLVAQMQTIPDRNAFTTIDFSNGDVSVQTHIEQETQAERKIKYRYRDYCNTRLPVMSKFTSLERALITTVMLKGMVDASASIDEEDQDDTYEPDLPTVTKARKQALYSSHMAAMSAHQYCNTFLDDAMGMPSDLRRHFTVARTMSLLSLATNRRLKEALKTEHKGDLRRALQYEIEAAPEIEFRSWSDYDTLHTRVAHRLIQELRTENTRLMEFEPATIASLLDLSQPNLNPLAELEATMTAKQLAELLPARQKDVFWSTFQGESDQEIAARLGIDPSTVRSYLSLSRKKIQLHIGTKIL